MQPRLITHKWAAAIKTTVVLWSVTIITKVFISTVVLAQPPPQGVGSRHSCIEVWSFSFLQHDFVPMFIMIFQWITYSSVYSDQMTSKSISRSSPSLYMNKRLGLVWTLGNQSVERSLSVARYVQEDMELAIFLVLFFSSFLSTISTSVLSFGSLKWD